MVGGFQTTKLLFNLDFKRSAKNGIVFILQETLDAFCVKLHYNFFDEICALKNVKRINYAVILWKGLGSWSSPFR